MKIEMIQSLTADFESCALAPHSGLGMKSPVEYRKLMDQAV